MIKKIVSILLVVLLLMPQVLAFAEPSGWAVEFIDNADSDKLIPQAVKGDYQKEIKRFEYVLLALKVLDQNNVNVEITDANPFTDIESHPYKTEIIKAYNAGIISGYTDNTFRPSNDIVREEVAALVYNLVNKINSSAKLPTSRSLFSDGDNISEWAKPFVEFNYKNNIISGTGKVEGLDTINPKGKTSREEAITLLYKISVDRNLIAQYVFSEISSEDGLVSAENVRLTAGEIGYNVMNKVIELSEKGEITILYVLKDAITFELKDKTLFTISKSDFQDNIDMFVYDLDNDRAFEIYSDLINIKYPNNTFVSGLEQQREKVKSDVDYYFNETISDDAFVVIYSMLDEELVSSFSYRRDR